MQKDQISLLSLHSPRYHSDVDSMNLDEYNIHVIASVFKQWLRELPNPLMTIELYDEFIRAMGKSLTLNIQLCCSCTVCSV